MTGCKPTCRRAPSKGNGCNGRVEPQRKAERAPGKKHDGLARPAFERPQNNSSRTARATPRQRRRVWALSPGPQHLAPADALWITTSYHRAVWTRCMRTHTHTHPRATHGTTRNTPAPHPLRVSLRQCTTRCWLTSDIPPRTSLSKAAAHPGLGFPPLRRAPSCVCV